MQTSAMQDWVMEVAKAEKKPGEQFDARNQGSPDWHRVVELADEINRQGTSAKIGTMAEQIQRTFEHQLDGAEARKEKAEIIEAIRRAFKDLKAPDVKTVIRHSNRYHTQVMQAREAMVTG